MSKKIKGKTQSGFAYEIEEARLNNYELLETIGELEDNPMVISKMVIMLLGKEQTNKLKDHLRDEEGLVPVDKMTEEITEIFQSQAVKK
ncbi:hypothetical protein [Streptomyces sp. P17]|jgi:hypothetical protein|uniref:hypothetical protein n=1 Tax=Streptomyces sp. P17 TaxID=3074716 RepID=UPI00259E35D5|nr:hypothetical protein [Streptomyces sp. P17]MDG4868757.1 hypothetical protein [Guyparkeria sp. 1SP6A2]MDM7320496.1 hypothetical protein [Fervidobacterium sp.]MDT9700896.1 hypothetical protein [Streptomyces sp. P17]